MFKSIEKNNIADTLLEKRERKGLRLSIIFRILFILGAIVISLTVSQNFIEKVLTLIVELVALLIFILLFFLINKIKRNILVGISLSIIDILSVSLIPVAFYFSTVKEYDISSTYLLKTVVYMVVIVFIVINTISTRPIYIMITTVGFVLMFACMFIFALLDEKTIISYDYIEAYMGPALNPNRIIIEIFVLLSIGIFLSIISNNFRNTLKEAVKYEERLLHQEKKAIVGTLTTGMAHEIKNQLLSISLLEIIKNQIPEKEHEYLQHIFDSRDRILSIIDEIRALARNEEVKYNLMPYGLKKLINESVILIRLDKDAQDIDISINFKEDVNVLVDKNKIVQVLINLLRNAVQAVKINKGVEGKININTRKLNDFIEIEIIDNGIGIPDDKLKNIWLPFYTTKGDMGIGLGLDISKRIIEGHNGRIYCCNNDEGGTCFAFTLPLYQLT